jgi:sugar phosphate isomerase/epimerase
MQRRGFLKTAAAGMAASLLPTAQSQTQQPGSLSRGSQKGPLSEAEKAARIATNCYGLRQIFKSRLAVLQGTSEQAVGARKQFGEIAVMDLPAFTRDHFPGVVRMDLLALFFGDMTDDSQYKTTTLEGGRTLSSFDPTSASARKWLEKMRAKQEEIGVHCHHISNDAVPNLSDPDPEKRRANVAIGKQWIDAANVLGAKSMRLNTGGPSIAPAPVKGAKSPSSNDALVTQLKDCIASFKELADYAQQKDGVKVTIENHWGIAANPINIRIIMDAVNSPFCEASPDMGNWEHELLIHNALADLAPYAHTTVHAKYWDRWTPEQQDVQKDVRILIDRGYEGVFALEYESGPWNSVEGSLYLYREVMAAL